MQMERSAFNLFNQHRRSLGLKEFEWNELIAEQCRIHSQRMAKGDIPFSHAGSKERSIVIADKFPFSRFHENIARITDLWGISSISDLVLEKWLNNEDHRGGIEGNFNLTGIGVAKNGIDFYYTQISIKTR